MPEDNKFDHLISQIKKVRINIQRNLKVICIKLGVSHLKNKSIDKNASSMYTKLLPLAPKSDLNDNHYLYYKNYLDDALSNTDVHNIAITGKYGSGKSSIIDSYIKDRSDFLRVNFATFESNNGDYDKGNKDASGLIFSNIINQIIYQIDGKKIPLTRFKVKHPISRWMKIIFIIELVIVSTYFLTFPIDLPEYIKLLKITVEVKLFKFAVAAIIGIYIFWHFLSKIEINQLKLKFKQVETEIDMSKDDLFEKYTDEIIYLFENSDKNILIIEDLDRFNNLSIFEKLRELNTKLNYKSNKTWKFIYLIKDELFVNKNDRVKFFDEIIPVIPFITSSNSFDKLRTLFNDKNINIRLLQILSVYIDDYRLLLNISNEFKVYKNVAFETNSNELLALIAYKNLYPSQFDDIQNGEGDLAEVVRKYKIKIQNRIQEFDDKISEMRAKKDISFLSSEAEYLYVWASGEELKYVFKYSGWNDKLESISSVELAKQIITEDLLVGLNLRTAQAYSVWKQNNDDFNDKLKTLTSYDNEIIQLNNKIEELKQKKLVDIERDDFEINDILYALIKNNFITNDYLNVINHYYGDNSTLSFMKNILSESDQFDMTLPLNDIEGIKSQLDESDYDKKQVLNVNLANYFWQNSDNHFDRMIQTGYSSRNDFLEILLNDNAELYDKIVEIIPDIKLNLSQLNEIQVEDIIIHNRYENTNSNIEIIVKWIENSKFEDDMFIDILNNKIIYASLKDKLIKYDPQLFKVDHLKRLNDTELWPNIIKNNLIDATNSNVNKYLEFINSGVMLANFINGHELIKDVPLLKNVFEWTLDGKELYIDKFSEIWEDYDYSKISYEQIEDIDDQKIQILLDKNKVELASNIIKLIDEKELNVPLKWDLHEVKNLIVRDDISLSHDLLLSLLEIHDESNDLIFSNNLVSLSRYEVIAYCVKRESTLGKIVNIVYKIRGYLNFRFDNNQINNNLLNWLLEQDIISDWVVEDSGKLRIKK